MIDFKNKYRQYKISQVLGEEFSDVDFLKMMDHIKKNITNKDYKQFYSDEYPNMIWYGLNINNVYIQHDLKNNTFWLDYGKIWSFFETEFGYNYQEIKDITEVVVVVGEHYKLKEATTVIECFPSPSSVVGEHYKLKEIDKDN